ncbi:hypothetical protein EYF80_012935 [Liparis tanakae]|uniref:Uncharacterized protein n=1 Tax=Liparis tanakae TaxID=230148 RepID=A0A4Z2IHT3_9TELE|nr:hypothetical protein EYF80_012935 [Liparis tanakae]
MGEKGEGLGSHSDLNPLAELGPDRDGIGKKGREQGLKSIDPGPRHLKGSYAHMWTPVSRDSRVERVRKKRQDGRDGER